MGKTARHTKRDPYQKTLAKVARFIYLAEDAAGDLPRNEMTEELYERLRGFRVTVGRALYPKKDVDVNGNVA